MTTYKTAIKKIDDEYQVRLYVDGKEYEPARYFTDHLGDARGTAAAMLADAERRGFAPGRVQAVDDDEPDDSCSNPSGHEWVYTGTAYGGDDDAYHGEGRCYCAHCGADGDA